MSGQSDYRPALIATREALNDPGLLHWLGSQDVLNVDGATARAAAAINALRAALPECGAAVRAGGNAADALEKIAKTAEGCIERIAEVGEPPPHWAGTQLDPVRVAAAAREALESLEPAEAGQAAAEETT